MRTLLVSAILLIFICIQLMRGADGKQIIDGDGSGYYAYLTAVFVYKTTDFTQVYEYEKSRRGLDYMGHYFHDYHGKKVNKYYLGSALLMLPFFLMAWLYSLIAFLPLDGYNIIFQYAAALAGAAYLAVGMIFTNKLLKSFGISNGISLLVILALMFGSNLFFYAFLHPTHSHIYSFAAISVLLYVVRSYFTTGNRRYIWLSAIALGFVGLIRPTNLVIFAVIPFFAGDASLFWLRFKELFRKPSRWILAIVLFLVVFFMQLLFNYIQTGELILYTYRNEGFHFLEPAIFSFLFSYRKGFFVYTPLMLLTFSGLVVLFRSSRYQFYWITGFLILLIYMLSSWWNWFFGDSFGMRAMVDFYPLLAVLVALGCTSIWKIVGGKIFLILFLLMVIPLNLIQVYQYQRGILHPDSMDKEKYWHVFLKTADRYRNIFGGYPEPIFSSLNTYKTLDFFTDMESPSGVWTSNGVEISGESYSGMHMAKLGASVEFSPTLVLKSDLLRSTAGSIYLSSNVMFRELSPNAAGKALLVYAATNKQNQLLFYKTLKLKQLPDDQTNQWRNASFGMKVPAWTDDLAQVKVYIWNPDKQAFQLDDFSVSFYLKPLSNTLDETTR